MEYEPLEVATFATQLVGSEADGVCLVRFVGRATVTLIVLAANGTAVEIEPL